MNGYLIKPDVIQKVYVAGGNDDLVSAISMWLDNFGLKAVFSQRNRLMDADWRVLADQYNHNTQVLSECELFLALLDDSLASIADSCVEMGLAFANGIPILGLCVSSELRTSLMINGICRGDEQLAYSLEELFDLIQEYVEIGKAVDGFDELDV